MEEFNSNKLAEKFMFLPRTIMSRWIVRNLKLLVLIPFISLLLSGCASYKVMKAATHSSVQGTDFEIAFVCILFWGLGLFLFFKSFNRHHFRKADFIWKERHNGEMVYYNDEVDTLVGHEEDSEGNVVKKIFEKSHEEGEYYDPPMWECMDSGANGLAYICYIALIWYFSDMLTVVYPEFTLLILVLFIATCAATFYIIHKYTFRYTKYFFKIVQLIIWIICIVDVVWTIIRLLNGKEIQI